MRMAEGAVKEIVIDGFNLGLAHGTGVATYSRNLSFQLRDLGHRVSVLYGTRTPRAASPLLREVSFFDDAMPVASKLLDFLSMLPSSFLSTLGFRAFEIPVTGAVVTQALEARLPHFDRLYNVPRLFDIAHLAFEQWGQIGRVSVPNRADLMH